MKFTFTCKKISLNDSVKAYAEKKIGKLEKYFKEEPEATVTFAVEKKNRCIVEVMLRGANGTLFRAVCEDADGDMRGAIDEAVSQIDRKIRKNKTRLAKNLRSDAIVPEVPEEFDIHEEREFDIVRTKRFAVKPMSPEEAILQMNLLGHSFFVFRNTDDDNAICVVYTRNSGGYGIIETSERQDRLNTNLNRRGLTIRSAPFMIDPSPTKVRSAHAAPDSPLPRLPARLRPRRAAPAVAHAHCP